MSENSRINEAHLLMANECYPVLHRSIVNLMADRDSARAAAMSPLQAAALAALVAWRKVGLAFDRTSFDSWPDWHEQWEASEEALRTTADALLAAGGGTG